MNVLELLRKNKDKVLSISDLSAQIVSGLFNYYFIENQDSRTKNFDIAIVFIHALEHNNFYVHVICC